MKTWLNWFLLTVLLASSGVQLARAEGGDLTLCNLSGDLRYFSVGQTIWAVPAYGTVNTSLRGVNHVGYPVGGTYSSTKLECVVYDPVTWASWAFDSEPAMFNAGVGPLDYEWKVSFDPDLNFLAQEVGVEWMQVWTPIWQLLICMGVGVGFGWCIVAPLEVN